MLFVLKDGSQIHRIEPSTDVYDYDTGKLIGRVGPPGSFVRLWKLVRRSRRRSCQDRSTA